jgi:hypothetical protein
MTTLNKAILMGLCIGSLNIAFAEDKDHFNDRSNLPTLASSGQVTSLPAGLTPRMHFNDRNAWVYEVPSKGPIQCAVDSAAWVASSHGFSDKYSNQC